ncbi:hypothetical protein JG688_00008693, partial [Phytophthora aleatoria]
RQHIFDCALKRKIKRGASLFVAPIEPLRPKSTKQKADNNDLSGPPTSRRKRTADLSSDVSENGLPIMLVGRDADEQDKQDLQHAGAVAPGSIEEARARAATTFRPTTIEKQIHDEISHPDHQGKDPHCILEFEQQARGSLLLGTPPVLRGDGPVANMTDFARKNCIQPASKDPLYSELTEARCNLRQFGNSFYNNDTAEVLRAAQRLWGNLTEIVRLTVTRSASVKEFSLHDPLLSELLYDQRKGDKCGSDNQYGIQNRGW